MEYEKLTYEEKIALARRLKAEGITFRTVNVQNDKNNIFNILWSNESDSPYHKPLQQKILDIADYLSFNYHEKEIRRNKQKYVSFIKRTYIPANIDDQYREILEALIHAVVPYADNARETWKKHDEKRLKAKCKFCRSYSQGKCNNPDSCRYGDCVSEYISCSCFDEVPMGDET